MAAPEGNDFGLAIKDPEMRQRAFKDFCRHIAEGYPVGAWSYREGEIGCVWRTMLSYLDNNPDEFHALLKEEAHCHGYKKWFEKGVNLTDGKVKGNPSPQTWATIMRNMFQWDKDKKDASDETKSISALQKIAQFLGTAQSPSLDKTDEANHSE